MTADVVAYHQEIAARDKAISELTNQVLQLAEAVGRIENEAFYFGTVIKTQDIPDPLRFTTGDKITVVDEESKFFGFGGEIIQSPNDEGFVKVALSNGIERNFQIGTHDVAQVRLVAKADGTTAIVNVDGKPWEVIGAPSLKLKPGDCVKIYAATKQIFSHGDQDLLVGPVVDVEAVQNEYIEVSDKGEKRVVLNINNLSIEEGDRVVVDQGFFNVLKKLPQDPRNRYKLLSDPKISWDQIGGLSSAKQQCQEAIVLPYTKPEIFKYYGVKPVRGILLHGPQGCGKTLLARAIASAFMQSHNDESDLGSGYIFVKSPEILSKWVGNTELEIRTLFERGREHYRKNGYKAVLVFDEFDAIGAQRGVRRTSDITDTIVPMFLGEMDGVDEQQTLENPLVIVMTNRASQLDPAIIRKGRIDKHIKVTRPDRDATLKILQIHTNGVPFDPSFNKDVMFHVVCQDIFSKSRLLYRINNEHSFTFGDCVNGALLEGICETAKMNAVNRDLMSSKQTGLTLDDFQEAINSTFKEQFGLNHTFDLEDFADQVGIQIHDAKIDRCFANQ